MEGIMSKVTEDTTGQTVDAGAAGLTEEDLKHLQADLKEFKEKELVGRTIFPVNSNPPSWAKTTEYDEVTDKVYRDAEDNAHDEFTAEGSTDIMMVEENVERRSNVILERNLGIELDEDKLDASEDLDKSYRQRKMSTLRRAFARFEERLVWIGSTGYGIPGAATISGAQAVSPSNGNAWNSGSKTPENILDDVDKLIEQLNNQEGFFGPFDIAVPLDRHALLTRTRIAPDQGATENLKTIIEEDEENVANITASSDLQDTNGSGQHTAMAIDGGVENAEIMTPVMADMRDPRQMENGNTKIIGRIKTGGLNVYDLNSLVQMDGV